MGILRLTLALIVVFQHSCEVLIRVLGNNGPLAVFAFFIISGFYMAQIADRYGLRNPSVKAACNFYASRALRIYPLYFACLALCLLDYKLGYFNLPHNPLTITHDLWNWRDRLYYVFENLFLFGQAAIRFLPYDPAHHAFVFDPSEHSPLQLQNSGTNFVIMGVSWTLSNELTFYLLVPLIMRSSTAAIMVMCLLSLWLRSYFHLMHFDGYGLIHTFFPTNFGVFLMGVIAHRLGMPRLERLGDNWALWLGFAALAVLALFSQYIYEIIPDADVRNWSFLFLVAAAVPFLFNGFRYFPFDRLLGELSYPVYLTHILFLKTVTGFRHPALAVAPCAIVLSILLYVFIVRPVDRYRHRRFKHWAKPVHFEEQSTLIASSAASISPSRIAATS